MAHGTVDIWIGIFFVVFYSVQRFNTPPTNRSSTTFGRYFLALFPYCLSAVAMYLVLVLGGTPALVQFLTGNAVLDDLKEALSHPLAMALLLTVALPKVPLLADLDRWTLRQLQGFAAIPFEVRRLTAVLCKKAFTVPEDVQVTVMRRLQNEGFDERDIRFTGEQTPARDWTVLTALLMRIDDWRCDRRMAGYFLEYGDVLQGLRDRHAALMPKARISFKLLQETRATSETDKAREAIQRYVDDFSEQVSKLREDLLAFISRGILRADLTDGARYRRLTALGFPVELDHPRLPLNQMLGLFGWVLVLILSASVFADPFLTHRPAPTMGVLLGRALTVSLIYTAAVACAVLPKQRWSFANRDPGRSPRPVGFYFVAGGMAVLITQSMSFLYNCGLERSVHGAAYRLLLTYPWALLTFAMAVVTAFLVDDHPPRHWPSSRVSAVEGISAAVVMMLVALVTIGWLEQRVHTRPDLVAKVTQFRVPPLLKAMSTAGAVAFLVGLLVPKWWRDAPRRNAEPPEVAAKASTGALMTTPPVLPPAAAARSS